MLSVPVNTTSVNLFILQVLQLANFDTIELTAQNKYISTFS